MMTQENIYVPGETLASAGETPELVGRENVLEQIKQAIRDTEQSHIVYIIGQGGIGKTRLVKHVLEHPPADVLLVVASELIDLYHTPNRTPEGLGNTIQKIISPDGEHFENYAAARKRLDEYIIHPPDKAEEVRQQRKAMLKALLDDMNALAENKRILLALDTTEKLFSQKDPAAESLGLPEERPAILDWLLHDLLPNIHNVVVLLAGRPGPGSLAPALAQIGGKQFLPINLPGLTESEALEYFDAASQITPSIQQWSREDRQAVFYCLCDDGPSPTIRPILLALAIMYRVIGGEPAPVFRKSFAEARALSPDQRRDIQNQLGQELVEAIHDHFYPADEVIRALGWLHKGADAELLARIAELDQKDIQNALDEIKDFVFVKTRPTDNRFFLHDEMYALLQQHVLDNIEARGQTVFDTLQIYYNERINRARDEATELYKHLIKSAPTEPALTARARLQDALVEDLHYRLYRDAAEGFQTYFKYAEEAIAAADESLDMQLRAELLGFLAERDPSGTAEEIDGLRRADVVADAAVRWIKRLIYDGRHEQALETAKRLRTEAKDLIEAGGDLAQAELCAWEALAYLYTGSYDEAQQLLDRALGLEETDIPPKQDVRWSAVLARAYNNLGYLRRVRGQFESAVADYKEALPLWKYAEMEADRANTLNNQAFALALSGNFDNALDKANKALTLRKQLGPRAPVALTYNTLAGIETRAGNYQEAERYAEQASSISQSLGFKRGEGLALITKSILHRYMSEDSKISAAEKLNFLNKAVSESAAALRMFTQEIAEPEREIRAYMERGLSSRELSQVSEPGARKEEYISNAITDLDRAKNRAEETGLEVFYLDASLGLAWTYYYAGEEEQLERTLRDLENYIQEHFSDYRITADKLPDRKEDTLAGAFAQFGRLYVLRGSRAMDAFERSDKHPPYPDLQKAAREFAIALEYDMLIAREYVGIQRAINTTIMKRLDGLSKPELKVFYDTVAETARGLGKEKGRLWDELESHFGIPYKVLKRLVK